MNDQLKLWIKENLLDSLGKISPKKLFQHPDKKVQIFELTNFLSDKAKLSQRCWHILNDVFYVVKCCVCNEKEVTYVNLKEGYKRHCSQKCSMRNPDVIKKYHESMVDLYGSPWPMQSKDILKKSEESCLKKYGVTHYTKTNTHINSVKERYRNESDEERETRLDKNRKTNLERYGVDWFSKTESFKSLCKEKWLENYGVEHPSQSKEILDKILFSKYKTLELKFDDFVCELNFCGLVFIGDTIPMNVREPILVQCNKGHIFERCINALTYNKICPKCNAITSRKEQELKTFLIENGIDIKTNDRKILKPKELDIIINGKNIAIEFDGIYWHSEGQGTHRKFHLNKTNGCKEKGISLIHVFEDEWDNKSDIVKSVLLSKIGKSPIKIFARKCVVKEVTSKKTNKFLESNHLQGKCRSSIKLGLFYNDELVSCMTFGKRLITGKTQLELLRFCNKLNTQVVGGASKLMAHFIRNNEFDELISYADRRWSNGDMYEKLGFELSHISPPSYWYIEKGKRIHRSKFMKHKLPKILKSFDPNFTEWENMQMNGFDRIWDCGCLVYKFQK